MTAPADATAASYLVVAVGTDSATAEAARSWVAEAEGIAPTRLVVLDSLTGAEDREELVEAVGRTRVGVRILVTGGRYDVLQALAVAREHGALPHELSGRVTHERDLPVYCAHCRATHRVEADPGGEAACPGCGRHLEIHQHVSAVRGSYLASDARARELAS